MLHWNCLQETVWSDFIIWMKRVFSSFFVAILHDVLKQRSIYLYLIIFWIQKRYTVNNPLWHNSQKYSSSFKKTELNAPLSVEKLIDYIFNKNKIFEITVQQMCRMQTR